MAQQVKALTVKPDNLSQVPGIHGKVEGELTPNFPCDRCPCTLTTLIIIIINKISIENLYQAVLTSCLFESPSCDIGALEPP